MMPGWEAIHKFPGLIISLLIGTGIWLGSLLPDSAIMPLLLLVAATTLCTTALLLCRRRRSPGFTGACCGFVLCLALGALKYRSDDPPRTMPPATGARHTTTILGVIADAPFEKGNTVRFAFRTRAFVVGDSAIPFEEIGIATCVGVPAGDSIRYGAVVVLSGKEEEIPEAGNSGEFSPRQYYHANGITFMMRVRGAGNVRVLGSDGGSYLMQEFVLPLRSSVLAGIDRDIGGEEGEFLKGLLIGERSGLSPEVRRAFLDSGVAHILAVSGSNVAVVAATILMCLSLLRMPGAPTRVLTMGGLLIYMYISGAQPPVVRATIMAMALFIGSWLSRRTHPLNGVGLAALVMFAIDARQLFDVGFQLSFGAVLSILLIYPRLMLIISRRPRTGVWRLVRPVYSLVAVSVAASIGTVPLTALAFGRLSLVGFLANLVIVPASGASVVLGLISAAVEPLSHWAAGSYAAVNRVILMLTIAGARIAASVPWATLNTVGYQPIHALPYYAGLACLCCIGNPGWCRRLLITSVLLADGVLFCPVKSLATSLPEGCRITMIDVGQGDALLLQSPGGQNYLVDTGPPSRDGSAWGGSVVPLLKRLGIQSLDAVVLSHLHDDHAGGFLHVLQNFHVESIIVSSDVASPVRAAMRGDSNAVTPVSRGSVFGDSLCRLYVLGPDPTPAGSGENANRRSVILKMYCEGLSAILMGDAEQLEEAALISRYGAFLRANIVKVGHHGSKAGMSADFLETVDPERALISVGRYNRFGHPAPATLGRLNGRGVEVLRTDEMGAVFLILADHAIHRVEWR
jgi:competence protein ComEC